VEDRLSLKEKIMSLKEALLGFIDNVSLPAIFSRKAENLDEVRKPLLKGIVNAKRQFESGQTRAPHRWWKVNNDVVALTVKVSGSIFSINGADTNHIPSERFADFLDKFTEAVDAGEFDDELRNKGAGDATIKIPRARRASAKPAAAAEPVAIAAPDPVEPRVAAAPAKSSPAPNRAPRVVKSAKASPSKPKRKPVDAKTAHARATKAAATRAANKAKKAEPATAEAAS
jgi:hypothetical protein